MQRFRDWEKTSGEGIEWAAVGQQMLMPASITRNPIMKRPYSQIILTHQIYNF
jgi:hypothetical protein